MLGIFSFVAPCLAYKYAGGNAAILFVCSLPGVRGFRPNGKVNPEIPYLLRQAKEAGTIVKVLNLALDCENAEVVLLDQDLPVFL